MTQISPPKNFGFFKRIVFFASFISLTKALDSLVKNLEIEIDKVKEVNTLGEYIIQKTKFQAGLEFEVDKIKNSKNKLVSQLSDVDISKKQTTKACSNIFFNN